VIDHLRQQLTALAAGLAQLRERIGRSSCNFSKPPSSDGPGFKPPERRKVSGSKRGGQPGHTGFGLELLAIERVNEGAATVEGIAQRLVVSSDRSLFI
jgi:hypothetical protein